MTWWQTLLIAVIPALVTAGALVGQQALTTRNERALHRLRTEDEHAKVHRTEVVDALRSALAEIGGLDAPSRSHAARVRARVAAGIVRQAEPELNRDAIRASNDALTSVVLLCSSEAGDAAARYAGSVQSLEGVLRSSAPTVEAIDAALAAMIDAHEEFLDAARAELGHS